MNYDCLYSGLSTCSSELSKEHIIPEVLGGWITIPVVCKKHNNELGHKIDSCLKETSFIARAIDLLGLQDPPEAYRRAKAEIEFPDHFVLNARLDGSKTPHLFPQQKGESLVSPEEQAPALLRKQVERYCRKNRVKVEFDPSSYDKAPYDQLIEIPGTDISYIKRRNQPGKTVLTGFRKDFPTRAIAKIALNFLASICNPWAMMDSMDPLKMWILSGDVNAFVLQNQQPVSTDFTPTPYHFIRLSVVNSSIVAIIGLFGVLIFSVFLGDQGTDTESRVGMDRYYFFGVNNHSLFEMELSENIRQEHDLYLKAVARYHRFAIDPANKAYLLKN